MRLLIIEAVMRRMTRVLTEELLRQGGPYVVISGSEIKRKKFVGPEYLFHLAPFGLCGVISQTLDRVTDADHERGTNAGRQIPDMFIDAGASLAGAIAKNY